MNRVAPLLSIRNLVVEFPLDRHTVIHAVSDISFDIEPGETLGLVGESGCGKSTVARAVVRLSPPTAGKILFEGRDLLCMSAKALRTIRPQLQMIFQDSIAALNPRRRAWQSIAEPLRIKGGLDCDERKRRSLEMLTAVGLQPELVADRRPFEFSGGQCQRIQIARALVTEPRLLICDEPVSALDVSVQAQILNLLEDLKAHYHLTMLFISHDLAVVKNICDRVAVMYLGRLCEVAPSQRLYHTPRHPYTAALLQAIPQPDPARALAHNGLRTSEIPSPATPPPGCRFHTRCPRAQAICRRQVAPLAEIEPGHQVACHFPLARI